MSTKALVNLVICLIIAGASYLVFRVWEGGNSKGDIASGLLNKEDTEHFAKSIASSPGEANGNPDPASDSGKSALQQTLERMVRRWDAGIGRSRGNTNKAELQSICEEAVLNLGASNELAEFINHPSLSSSVSHRDWLLGPGLGVLFSGANAEKNRNSMLEVKDVNVRNALCKRAGETFGALGFKEYLDSLEADHADCQSPLLTGRCVALAQTNLEGAVYAFRELKTRRTGYDCLGAALAIAFANMNYTTAKTTLGSLPDDLKSEAVSGMREKQGRNVGPFLAAVDEVINTADWAKAEKTWCVKLHNLAGFSTEYETLLAWAALLPERSDTMDLYRVAIRSFVTNQPDKAKQWILSLPQGWKRENSLAGFVQSSLAARGDVTGAKWARGLIQDPAFAASADGWFLDFEKRSRKVLPQ
ncbi:MAG: hypothetical protein CFE26_03205 [Verrucomicrobiales bacterium VVV1]|nr:MAG: hypothetical protein CFE26_03205 [Verrucomicrobiales bacterium VVV1]